MLETLLFQYRDQFGEPFPLSDFAGVPEIEVINILYDCVQENTPYVEGQRIGAGNRFPDAPGARGSRCSR